MPQAAAYEPVHRQIQICGMAKNASPTPAYPLVVPRKEMASSGIIDAAAPPTTRNSQRPQTPGYQEKSTTPLQNRNRGRDSPVTCRTTASRSRYPYTGGGGSSSAGSGSGRSSGW